MCQALVFPLCLLSAVGSSCPLVPASSIVMSTAQSHLAVTDLSSDGLSPMASTCAGSRCFLSFGSHLTSLSLFSHQLSMPRKHTWGPPCMLQSNVADCNVPSSRLISCLILMPELTLLDEDGPSTQGIITKTEMGGGDRGSRNVKEHWVEAGRCSPSTFGRGVVL